MQLNGLDWAIIGIYVAMLLSIGWSLRKFAQQGLENYFLGGRNLPGWLNGLSYASTCLNADVAPFYCGLAVATGLYAGWFYIARFGWALLIGGVLFAVFWRRLKIFTAPEFYELRFQGWGASWMRGWIAFRSAFIAIVAWTGAGLLGMTKVITPIFGIGRVETMLAVVPVILVYLYFSGYLGVVITDAIQSLFILLGSTALLIAVLVDFGGPTGLGSAIAQHFPQAMSSLPPAHDKFVSLFAVVAFTFGTSVGYGGDACPLGGAMEGQRILSSRDGREASRMYLWTELALFLFLLTLTLPALGAMVIWPGLRDGSIDQELAYGMLIHKYIPSGLLGLVLVSVVASLMSTVSSNLNFGAQVAINDIYRRYLRPDKSEAHYLKMGKLVSLLILVLSFSVVFGVNQLLDIAVFMIGLSAAELPANWAQWWWWRFNTRARLAASIGGPVIYLLVRYVLLPQQDFAVWILAAMALTTALWVSVALLTPPDDEAILERFYARAQPLGWWGPIARRLRTVSTSAGEQPQVLIQEE
ncbi:sodium:solute symporter family transporter [Gloeobacter kilaueensis]|uniref:Na+/solute symporter n=1 Tax=Gloeobacter kilaueensis (strain ATCC BAA-2537 / CCAP 1431/1 / ULC 316 / JS1) TaxID=1183438 RepID=U5QKK8_GLOK1|nr:Na+/solute symporter [Gloeobacter kilaueensis]AGY58220.1 Na+/solute symporter [Gloeobacter kilaueensis JS1]